LVNRESEKVTNENIGTNKNINLENINAVVVIPALNPTPDLTGFVHKLHDNGVTQVIVVNDGSDISLNFIFQELEKLKYCTVLSHKENYGKGRALKTAFLYINKYFPNADSVVTADADGQHSVEDICKVFELQSLNKNSLILGVRDLKKMPRRSYIGNKLANITFKFFYGATVGDTQTGLRGIPVSELSWMIDLKGDRFEYEINMLIKASRKNIDFLEVPIETLYFDNNSGTHYNALVDSAKIFLRLFSGLIQFSGLTIISGLVDVIGFFLLNTIVLNELSAPIRLLISTVAARIISSVINYFMNKNVIFKNKSKHIKSAIRYYILFISLIAMSYGLVYMISLFWRVNESFIKLIIDMFLGLVSFQVQMQWVFTNEQEIKISI